MTDTERLDWLEQKGREIADGLGWLCRNSTTGRGMRLHQTSHAEADSFVGYSPSPTVREAIDAAMRFDASFRQKFDKPA